MTLARATPPRPFAPLLLLAQSWRAPGRVLRDLRGMSEGAMTAALLGAMALIWVAQMPGLARAAARDPAVPLDARLIGAGFATLFLMPLLAHGLAAGLAALSRGRLSGADSRLALFWALLAAAPAMLLAGLAEWLALPAPALTAARALAGIGFAAIWLTGLRAFWRRG